MMLELDWTLRQPKDAPWCWPAAEFYPCGCGQDDWDDDYYCDAHPYQCEECAPMAMYRQECDERDRARERAHVQDESFAARERWLRHYGWIKDPPLVELLQAFYIEPIKEQLNQTLIFDALFGKGLPRTSQDSQGSFVVAEKPGEDG